MIIRIAAISSEEFMPKILKHEQKIPNINLIPLVYDDPRDSEHLVDQIPDCDVVLFAGSLPYIFSRAKIKQKNLPVVYIESYEYKLAITLLHIKMNMDKELNSFSIDLPEAKFAHQVIEELDLHDVDWFIKDYQQVINGEENQLNIEEIIQYHKELWERKKTKFALTSIDFVNKRLNALGIPCFSMIVPENTIYEALKRAADYGELVISKNSQIAVGMITVNQYQAFLSTGRFSQDGTIAVYQMLLDVGKATEATIHQMGLDQFIIYGTRKSIEQIISYFQNPSLFKKIERVLNITVSVGFGFGQTAKAAEENARIALFYANKNTDSTSAYLVTDEKEVFGPLNADAKTFQLRSENQDVLDIVEKTGVGVATIYKLLQFLKLRNENRFTAKDLAEYLEVSRRNAERILKKLMDHQFVIVIGEEQPYQQGRPRAIYRINFPGI